VIPGPTALRAVNTRDVDKVRSQRRVGQVANFWQPELLGTLQQYATSNFCRLSTLRQEARGQSVLACASNGITPAGLQVAKDEPKVVDALCENTGELAEMKPSMSIVHLGRKTIGVDHGRKRTGVCVSVGYSPRPLPLICHDDNSTDAALQIAQLAINERAEQIVVGFPFNSTGGEGEQATYTREFVNALRAACSTCGIYLWDERFSTSIAREKLQQVTPFCDLILCVSAVCPFS
jgi:putative Holliday junction resolvase